MVTTNLFISNDILNTHNIMTDRYILTGANGNTGSLLKHKLGNLY